jgi:hypothetical protein
MITLPKAEDLSHLVDSRIGVPNANPTNLVINGGASGTTDWVDSNGDGLADGWTTSGSEITGYSIVTGNGFSGNAQRIEADGLGGRLMQKLPEEDLEIGKTYIVSFKYRSSALFRIYCPSTSYGVDTSIDINTGDAILYSKIFTLKAFDTNQNLIIYTSNVQYIEIDEVSFKEWSGEELVPDTDYGFVGNNFANWTAGGANTVEQDGEYVKVTYGSSWSGATLTLNNVSKGVLFDDLIVGQKYRVTIEARNNGGTNGVDVYTGTAYTGFTSGAITSENQIFTIDFIPTVTVGCFIRLTGFTAGESAWARVVSFKKVTGLVAAYNMIPSPEGVLVDISGNGRELNYVLGINKKPISSKDGLKFTDGHLGDSTAIQQVSLSKNYTVCSRFKIEDFSRNSGVMIWSNGLATNDRQGLNVSTVGHISYDNYNGSVYNGKKADGYAEENKWITAVCVCTSDSTSTKLYLDGEEITNVSNNGGLGGGASGIEIGGDGSTRPLIGEIADLKFFNYAFSAEEAQQYHNSFQKLTKRGNFSDHPVGSTIG